VKRCDPDLPTDAAGDPAELLTDGIGHEAEVEA